MRPRSVALLAVCIPLSLCDANDPAPRCAVNCASNIRNDKGALDLKVICGNKIMTNSLFQCLITSCPRDAYSPAVAHVILACSDLGIAIGPLYPVEVQHANMEKAQDLLIPSIPAAYGTPSDSSPQGPDHLTLSFDISVDLKCSSGSDGLVTVSLPPPAPLSSTARPPPPPSAAPNPDPGEGDGQDDNGDGSGDEGDGENDNGGNDNGDGDGDNGDNDNGGGSDGGDREGNNGNGGDGDGASSPLPKPTQAPADPSTTSSCPPGSASSDAQDPSNGQAPSPSTGGGDGGDSAATSAPSGSPGGGDPSSPASSPSPASPSLPASPASPSGGDPISPATSPSPSSPSSPASSASPAAPASPASTLPCSTASLGTGGLDPQNPNQSDPSSDSAGEGEEPQAPAASPAIPPAPTSSTPTAPSSTCSIADGANVSVNPVQGPQVSQPAESTNAVPPSSQPSSSASASASSPSDDPMDPSSGGPPEYSSASDFETSLPEPSREPLPRESQSTGAQAPSYGQSGLTLRSLTSQQDGATEETADSKPPSKTAGPSEITLWPTAKLNRTSHTTGAAGQRGSPTSSCGSDGKETVTTAHTPRANIIFPSDILRDASPVADAQQHESLSSVTVKIVRSRETVAETVVMTVLDTVPSAAATSTSAISDVSVVGSASGNSPTQRGFATTRPTSDGTSVESGAAAKESSAPQVALVNSVPRATPHLFTIALLIILVGGILLN